MLPEALALFTPLAFADDDLDSRIKCSEMGQKLPGEPAHHEPLRYIYSAGPDPAGAGQPGLGNRGFDLLDDRFGGAKADFASRREGNSPSATLENSCSY